MPVFDVIGKRRWFFLFSALLTIPGLIFIILTPLTGGAAGLQFSIDYTGGTNWEIRFQRDTVTADQIKSALAGQGVTDATVIATSGGFYEIRTRQVDLPAPPVPSPSPSVAPSGSPGASASAGASGSPGASASAAPSASIAPSPAASAAPSQSPAASASAGPSSSPSGSPAPSVAPSPSPGGGGTELPTAGKFGQIATALQDEFGPIVAQRALSTVGPVISQELTQQAALLVLLGSIGIVIWMTIRFHDVRFGATALVALVHDVIVVIGTFAILGTFFRVQIDALFVTAVLTVIGFSVHDTIVVYDRIRENRARHVGEPFDRIVNHSILQTFGRSINTSLTVVITLTALLLFGGSATTYFVLALLIGIVSGTYSSIFNAAPLLVIWHDWDERRKARIAAAGRPARHSAS
ncbi:MAG: protein translocase subunit SecF [Candidatus Limnocylindrales bacterium]